MAWLPKTIADKTLGSGEDQLTTLTGESSVLFIYPVKLNDDSVSASGVLVEYRVIQGSIIGASPIIVNIQELSELVSLPEDLAAEVKKGVSREIVAFISTLDADSSAEFIILTSDDSSVERQTYTRVLLHHAISSSNKGQLTFFIKPLLGFAIADRQLRKPIRSSLPLIAPDRKDIKRSADEDIPRDPNVSFTQRLSVKSVFHIYPPIPNIGARRREWANGTLSLLNPSDRVNPYMIMVKAPSYTYLIHHMEALGIVIPDYSKRVSTLKDSLTTIRDEERRVIYPKIEKKGRPVSLDGSPTDELVQGRVSPTSVFILSLYDLEQWHIATIRNHKEAKVEWEYFSRGALDGIDMRGAVVTGLALPATIYRPYGHKPAPRTKYKGYVKNEIPPEERSNDIRGLNIWNIDLNYPAYTTKDPHIDRGEEREIKSAVTIDIVVIDKKSRDVIIKRIIGQLMDKYPRLLRGFSDDGKHTFSDPEYKIRPIQIYSITLDEIVSHHTSPTRGWYDPTADTFYLTASAALSYVKRSIDDYYYLTEEKPLDIIAQLEMRGFRNNFLFRVGGYKSLRLGYDAVVNADGTLSYVDVEDYMYPSDRDALPRSSEADVPLGRRTSYAIMGRDVRGGVAEIRQSIRDMRDINLSRVRHAMWTNYEGSPMESILPPRPMEVPEVRRGIRRVDIYRVVRRGRVEGAVPHQREEEEEEGEEEEEEEEE